jgi:hypothetical protein
MPHISRSYGTDYLDLSRRAAYVGKIFKGYEPGELPIRAGLKWFRSFQGAEAGIQPCSAKNFFSTFAISSAVCLASPSTVCENSLAIPTPVLAAALTTARPAAAPTPTIAVIFILRGCAARA